uniref:Uncharacterized protein n=1 Tax=Candidatus Kentrum sp. FM TaxID=2126340 RepID=A0A450TLC7_9GAMM|nr:MAG: hypothetical protein BECKFM1743A_GA0114220_104756 [Candidatus Kentron sp. FM]VFJ76962.1 MAG: hypothetical protein BECKFM1743C_GA0114222_109553 [Candidatus Kentron sp. FM]VFK10590.1 MAG: hypothetical protein BECKFM1743B_GA0114221_1014511 [Candidatus Kentron sp. FM]
MEFIAQRTANRLVFLASTRYRYRDSLSLSILFGFFDSDSERTTTPVAARLRCTTIRPFLVFCARFPAYDGTTKTQRHEEEEFS